MPKVEETVWAAWCVPCQSYVIEESSYGEMRSRFADHMVVAHHRVVA